MEYRTAVERRASIIYSACLQQNFLSASNNRTISFECWTVLSELLIKFFSAFRTFDAQSGADLIEKWSKLNGRKNILKWKWIIVSRLGTEPLGIWESVLLWFLSTLHLSGPCNYGRACVSCNHCMAANKPKIYSEKPFVAAKIIITSQMFSFNGDQTDDEWSAIFLADSLRLASFIEVWLHLHFSIYFLRQPHPRQVMLILILEQIILMLAALDYKKEFFSSNHLAATNHLQMATAMKSTKAEADNWILEPNFFWLQKLSPLVCPCASAYDGAIA